MPLAKKPAKLAAAEPLALTITRRFNAPRSVVFKAWTTPERLAQWSGPRGFTTPHHHTDLRVGGAYSACLRAPDGSDHWLKGTYREITEPERLVMTHGWTDPQGTFTGPETLITVTFAEQAGHTVMTFQQTGFDSPESRDGHHGGWSESFDRLEHHLTEKAAP